MKRPRMSIARLMGVVAVLALNAGAARAFVVRDEDDLLIGVALMAVALQVGLLFRRRSPRFFAGFLVAGLVAMGSFLWAYETPSSVTRYPDGTLVRNPASRACLLLERYTMATVRLMERVEYPPLMAIRAQAGGRAIDEWLLNGTFALTLGLPQLLAASAGGLLTLGLARVASKRPGSIGKLQLGSGMA